MIATHYSIHETASPILHSHVICIVENCLSQNVHEFSVANNFVYILYYACICSCDVMVRWWITKH